MPVQPAYHRGMTKRQIDVKRLRVAPRDQTAMRQRLTDVVRRVRRGSGGSVAASYHCSTLTPPFHDKRVVELGLASPRTCALLDVRGPDDNNSGLGKGKARSRLAAS